MGLGDRLMEMNKEIKDIIGVAPFMYSAWPTPTTGRYVFQGGTFTEDTAMAHMLTIQHAASLGQPLPDPYAYFCRSANCPERFDAPTERDAHEAQAKHRSSAARS